MPANVPGLFNVQTNDLGEFRLYGLMPGTYIVSASPNGIGAMSFMAGGGAMTVIGANDGSDGFAPTYYPGSVSENDAQPITVSTGQETTVAFALVPTRLARVSGMVRTSQGQPAANVFFGVRSSDTGGFGFGGSTGPDGTFTLMNVPPGEYFLDVRPRMVAPGAVPADAEYASIPLTVGGEDVTNLMIVTGHGATIAGRVLFEGGTQQAAAQDAMGPMGLRVMFAPAEMGGPRLPMGGMDNGAIGPNGEFTLTGLSGKGTFSVSTSPQWSVKAVMLDGVNITDTPYEVKSGVNLSSLRSFSPTRKARYRAVCDCQQVSSPGTMSSCSSPRTSVR
jgi:hypothetical protein